MIIKVFKKPIVVSALQWTGANVSECKDFVGDSIEFVYPAIDKSIVIAIIHTLEGDMYASIGDYIIKGVDGEFYPCKEDIFLRTYIRVENLKVL